MAVREWFAIPNWWFGDTSEIDDMPPVVQVSLDGSYTKAGKNPRIFAYAGIFGSSESWIALMRRWRAALPDGCEAFRTSELVGKDGFPELRGKLGSLCVDLGFRAHGSGVNVAMLSPKSEAKRKRELFLYVVKSFLKRIPADFHVALVCDREQDLAKEVSAWLDRDQWQLKNENKPNVYDRIAGICYMNSRSSIQVQAADLVAGWIREHIERASIDLSAPIDPVLASLTNLMVKAGSRSQFVSELDGDASS